MKRPLRITPGAIAATALMLLVVAVCVRLGFWQLDRLEQRTERNRLIEERLATPALTVSSAQLDTTGLAYRTVELHGEYDHARSFILAGRALGGRPGVHVVTPLRLEGDAGVVLVNRGWLHSPDAASVDLAPYRDETGPVRLRGMVVPFFQTLASTDDAGARERTTGSVRVEAVRDADDESVPIWFRPDSDGVRASLPYPVADFIVQALPEEGAPDRPTRLPPPELDRGPHLGYAIQWFSFAAVALVGWGVLALRREDRRRPTAAEPSPR